MVNRCWRTVLSASRATPTTSGTAAAEAEATGPAKRIVRAHQPRASTGGVNAAIAERSPDGVRDVDLRRRRARQSTRWYSVRQAINVTNAVDMENLRPCASAGHYITSARFDGRMRDFVHCRTNTSSSVECAHEAYPECSSRGRSLGVGPGTRRTAPCALSCVCTGLRDSVATGRGHRLQL